MVLEAVYRSSVFVDFASPFFFKYLNVSLFKNPLCLINQEQ